MNIYVCVPQKKRRDVSFLAAIWIYMYVHEYICIVTAEEEERRILFFCGNNTNIFMYIHVYRGETYPF